jgi:hypothetical protein
MRTISSPSSTVMVIGFSHRTWKPASRKAFVISKWVALGVATVTRSTRSLALSFAFQHLAPVAIGTVGRKPSFCP